MNSRKHITLTALALVAAAGSAIVAVAGPLNPPAGPVASTFKTLAEVEPRIAVNAANTPGDANSLFRITQRGSYYLTGDITGVPGKFAITIASDNVTLDLGGFTLTGGAMGVYVDAPPGVYRSNVTVRNGSITGCTSGGLNAKAADGGVLADLTVQSCPGGGISVGPFGRMERCTANYCGWGLTGQPGARLSDCQANHNTNWGVQLLDGATIESSTASFNGFRGIDAWSEVTVRNCRVADNSENGIDGLDRCVVESCVVQANLHHGVHVREGSAVMACTVQANGHYGIDIGSGRVTDCTVASNSVAILFGGGIIATGTGGTRIEGNTLADQPIGILPVSGGCLVIRNDGRNVPNLIGPVAAVNSIGPIVSSQGAISSTNPWANFIR